jgi:creatinine amidohydrolase/Fe(II)-dependent formamide hydrolase-like protein
MTRHPTPLAAACLAAAVCIAGCASAPDRYYTLAAPGGSASAVPAIGEPVFIELAPVAVPERLAANRHVRFGGSVSFGWLSNDFGPSGAIGDPAGASAELGRRLFEASIDGLVEAMHEIAAFDFGR